MISETKWVIALDQFWEEQLRTLVDIFFKTGDFTLVSNFPLPLKRIPSGTDTKLKG